MKIGLVTTWEERCGLAEYAQNLVKHSEYSYQIIGRPFTANAIAHEAKHCDVICINHEPGLFNSLTSSDIRSFGKPTVVILHATDQGLNLSSNQFTDSATRVIVHEDCEDIKKFPNKWIKIPMGIPVKNGRSSNVYDSIMKDTNGGYDIGSFGFPFPWKGFYEVADAAKRMGKSCLLVMPESHHADAHHMVQHCKRVNHQVHCITEFKEQNELIGFLSCCKVLVFAYHGNNAGVSGAVRLAISTGKPIVVPASCRQFRDIFEWAGKGIYVAENPYKIDEAINQALVSGEGPKELMNEWSWEKTSKKYDDLFKEVIQ